MKHLHSWDVLARSCIDGRFIKRTVDWVSKHTEEVFDYRTGVGSSKAILDDRHERASFFNVIDASLRLHNIKEVWIADHIDCGAYGGSKHFDYDKDKEKEFHIKKLKEAEKIILTEFPHVTVKKIYVSWDKIEVIA